VQVLGTGLGFAVGLTFGFAPPTSNIHIYIHIFENKYTSVYPKHDVMDFNCNKIFVAKKTYHNMLLYKALKPYIIAYI